MPFFCQIFLNPFSMFICVQKCIKFHLPPHEIPQRWSHYYTVFFCVRFRIMYLTKALTFESKLQHLIRYSKKVNSNLVFIELFLSIWLLKSSRLYLIFLKLSFRCPAKLRASLEVGLSVRPVYSYNDSVNSLSIPNTVAPRVVQSKTHVWKALLVKQIFWCA